MTAANDIKRRTAELARAIEGTTLRLVLAESCTGGQIAALMARDAVLGPHLERGFIVYSADAKCEMLAIDPRDVARCDAVNPEVTNAMAVQALELSRADIAVALTGFCGPQQKGEEVGLVYLACAERNGRQSAQQCHFGDIGREEVLDHAVVAALALATEAVRNHDMASAIA